MKEAYDGAEPTGNSVAAMDLLRLYHLTNDQQWKQYTEKTLRYFCTLLEQSPQIMPQLMAVVEFFLASPEHLVIVAGKISEASHFLDEVDGNYLPSMSIVVLSEESRDHFVSKFSFMKKMEQKEGKTAAYFCKNYTCQLPTVQPAELRRQLTF
jgi:hypothetical protein